MNISAILHRIANLFQPKVNVKAEISLLGENELLKDRIALITGGTSGIGYQIAKSFLKSGATIVIVGRKADTLMKSCEDLSSENDAWRERIFSQEMDLTKIDEIEQGFHFITNQIKGDISILVNNAGVVGGNINTCQEDEFDNIIATNLKGAFFLSRVVAKYMVVNKIHGNILNICSSSSLRPANSVYTMSKWGLRALTMGLAKALIPHGIVVNGLAPGPTATPMLLGSDGIDNLYLSNIPAGRYALPEEIASMAVILVSKMAQLVVGDVVYMTGGAGLLTYDDIAYKFD